MRIGLALLLMIVSVLGVQAEERGGRADILWAGIYRADVVGFTRQPNTATGKTNKLANIQRLQTTTTVQARLGVSFGFEFALAGADSSPEAPVTMVIRLPRAGLRNPASNTVLTREEWQPEPRRAGEAVLVGYTLEHTWEVVPGLWTFEIWHNQRKIGEQSFCLVSDKKPAAPTPAPQAGTDEERCPSVPTV